MKMIRIERDFGAYQVDKQYVLRLESGPEANLGEAHKFIIDLFRTFLIRFLTNTNGSLIRGA